MYTIAAATRLGKNWKLSEKVRAVQSVCSAGYAVQYLDGRPAVEIDDHGEVVASCSKA